MSKVFVAGASGEIGRALMDRLAADGVEAVAGVHGENMDFADSDSMAEAMAGCDKLFLDVPLMEGMSRAGHLAVTAAKAAGIGYIVQCSRYAASSDAHWRLGREQGMIDQFVEDSGIPFTILRPNTLMQIFTTDLADMIRAGSLELAEDDSTVSYIDARDVADCAATLFAVPGEHENRMYALTGPEGLSGADVAAAISEGAGVKVAYAPVSEEVYVERLVAEQTSAWTVNMLVSLSRVVKLGMAGNVTKAVEFLSGTPARSFAEFVAGNAGSWS
ncbi:NAD(P)H-binding protein [Pseudodesulfovibrio cashew]|uniref:NAD(P)H-binding protein n=1 Tax=Pseudodesulfovibrio cashew TaxID=2678688 RepID=A0A6I6J9E1_9BACT|nr:NmrA family NAD(P)-binding protein [Pseudodesulfovibrio cashew]QGY39225.1 NAD(P)H-binding protein [Pseudodesulfovibrio cashew]